MLGLSCHKLLICYFYPLLRLCGDWPQISAEQQCLARSGADAEKLHTPLLTMGFKDILIYIYIHGMLITLRVNVFHQSMKDIIHVFYV